MFKRIAIFSLFTTVSRILGLIRDLLIAFYLGASNLSDVFFVAFRLPNLFRAFFAEGAFNISFIPIYSAKIDDSQASYKFATQTFSALLYILLIFSLFLEFATPYIIRLLTPGFYENIDKFTLTVSLSRIMIPYLCFISLASLVGGMLQVHHHFAASAGAPILLNLCLIASLLIPSTFTPAYNLSVAVPISGALQLLLMILVSYRLKIRFGVTLRLNFCSDTKKFFYKLIPAIFSSCITQVSVWFNTVFASFLPEAVSYIYYADRVNQLPQAIIGTAIGTVLLPLIAKHIRNNAIENAIAVQNQALEMGLMMMIPATAALTVISDAILLTLFNYGKFSYEDAINTTEVLKIFAFLLPSFVINKALLPTLYAMGNTTTPALFALISLIVNLLLNFLLIKDYGYNGIATASVIASWVNTLLLTSYLRKKDLYKISNTLSSKVTKFIISSLVMMLVMVVLNFLLSNFFFEKAILRISALTVIVVCGLSTYFAMLRLFLGKEFLSVLVSKK